MEIYRPLLLDSLKCIAWKGRAVVVGFAGGKIEKVLVLQTVASVLNVSQLPLNLVLLKNIEITGVHWGAYASTYSLSFQGSQPMGCLSLIQSRNRGMFLPYTKQFSSKHRVCLNIPYPYSRSSMLQSGKVIPVTYPEVYPLERLTEGLVALENRKTWGKAVVRVRDEPVPTARL
jgi:NADPH2:quinone reductase